MDQREDGIRRDKERDRDWPWLLVTWIAVGMILVGLTLNWGVQRLDEQIDRIEREREAIR